MPTCPEPVEDLDDLDVEDAFGHPVSGTAGLPVGVDGTGRGADGTALDDEGDVDDLDV
ncbi:hypothetical protein [Curtobacterium flaccumfaciens]|uniref:hypothetical protein n=1 Tax=Curtobacterium flaccumfaciens TaxID=2035 RepID=UPI001AD99524|nr:hypothetical protein [Curtobacterium flaccumfaciens]MBO9038510.1 hypothetical protein [Curtobacterium flaccumfaciens pv. flaccumfaciens]